MHARIHKAGECTAPCPFHGPSDHHMKDWPTNVRETSLVERICPHGIGHPDPDSLDYLKKRYNAEGLELHGCDGCCYDPKNLLKPCQFCGKPVPVTACGIRSRCPACNAPYPHGDCSD